MELLSSPPRPPRRISYGGSAGRPAGPGLQVPHLRRELPEHAAALPLRLGHPFQFSLPVVK